MRTLPQLERKHHAETLGYSQRNKGEGEVKLVTPVAMTQRERKKEEMPSCSQAMLCKPLLHVPPTSTPTESAVLGDKKKQLEMATEESVQKHPYL